jgi:anti-sigma regulatory factor (Ser/Thr protein kinase)
MAEATHDHAVQFYRREVELKEAVAGYLLDALRAGGVAVVLAGPVHRASLESHLRSQGVDVDDAVSNGRFVSLDARGMLKQILKDERPDPELFRAVMGSLIDSATGTGRPVHVYGEMVDLLWGTGHVNSAIELEMLWGELGQPALFSLYCACRTNGLVPARNAHALSELCQLHSVVVNEPAQGTPQSTSNAPEEFRTFPAHLNSPRASRRFVLELLQDWADDKLLADAALVVTELATNAVVHARSEFTVGIVRLQNGARISVRDAGAQQWAHKSTPLMATHGRGLGLVAALTNSWGKSAADGGKVVWAELTGASLAQRAET